MSRVSQAMRWAIDISKDEGCGYDQTNRWYPNFDCSSLIIQAFENAGIPVKSNGATYTGNMYRVFTKTGFQDITKSVNLANCEGLMAGDVLLKAGDHTALYIGNKQLVHASINELGKVTGGASGDQTGREICVRSYYNHPWTAVLRYTGESTEVTPAPKPPVDSGYTVGKLYTVKVNNLRVRTAPSTSASIKTKAQLTPNGRLNANSKGQLKAGTIVTCKAVQMDGAGNKWIQIPSGWVCAVYQEEIYVQ